MKMTDKNGKEIKTGSIVKIEGGYFKRDNGLFLVTRSPGDPSWSDNGYCLHKCNKKGEESKAGNSTAFWPLMVTVSGREKRIEAHEHNEAHATIEVVGETKVYKVHVKQDMGWSEHEYDMIATENEYQEMLTWKFTKVKVLA